MSIQRLRAFSRDRRGVVSLYFAMILFSMMAMMLASVDMLRVAMLRSRVQAALDFAVLAVGYNLTASQTVREADGRAYFNANIGDQTMGAVVDGPTFLDPVQSPNGTLYTLQAKVTVPLMITAFTGAGALEMEMTTTARKKTRADVELVLAIDNTGSMSGAKMTSAKKAAKTVVSTVLGPASGGNTVVGLVPFTETVNVGNNAKTQTWLKTGENSSGWKGCLFETADSGGTYSVTDLSPTETAQGATAAKFEIYHDGTVSGTTSYSEGSGQNNCIATGVTFLTSAKATLDTNIDKMTANGNTMIAAGAIWGWRMLSPSWQGDWEAGNTHPKPAWDGTTRVNKVLVLLTDGDNNVRGSGSGSTSVSNAYRNPRNAKPWGNITGTPNTKADNILWNVASPTTASYCKAAKDAGITVFTIPFDTTGSDITTTTDTLLEGCATSTEHFLKASDDTSLQEAFNKVIASLEEFVIQE